MSDEESGEDFTKELDNVPTGSDEEEEEEPAEEKPKKKATAKKAPAEKKEKAKAEPKAKPASKKKASPFSFKSTWFKISYFCRLTWRWLTMKIQKSLKMKVAAKSVK